jgi:hypothetical protein
MSFGEKRCFGGLRVDVDYTGSDEVAVNVCFGASAYFGEICWGIALATEGNGGEQLAEYLWALLDGTPFESEKVL